MEGDKLIKLFLRFQGELIGTTSSFYISDEKADVFIDLCVNARTILKDHETYLSNTLTKYRYNPQQPRSETLGRISYLLELLRMQEGSSNIGQRMILQGAKDKLKEAGTSFKNEDYTSVINSLNTAIELALKDELDIPTTISKINTRKVVEICLSENIGPVDYMKELIKHVLEIDNKIKHRGYNPSRVDCINAIAAVENFLVKIDKFPFKVTDAIKTKIFSGL